MFIKSFSLTQNIVYVIGHIGAKKSLLTVFQTGNCHPKLAMVIDDRLKVWEDKDQPRVHVVPAFTPYYAPQAEVCVLLFLIILISSFFCHIETEWELLFE